MIHETAVIDPHATIGSDVQIGPFCCVERDVQVGDGCVLGPHVTLMSHTTLGPRCRVHAGAVLGDLPQDLGFKGGVSGVSIGPDCVIREGVTVHRGTKPGTVTTIGASCFLMAFSHAGHNVQLGDNVIVANGVLLAGYVQVGSGAFLSGNAMVHQFVRVGRLAMLGGGAGASKDVPPFCTVHPVTLNEVAGLNVVGMRRAGFSPEERARVKQAFKTLYASGLNVSQAVERLKSEFVSGPESEFAEFVSASERGICGFVRRHA